MTRSSTRSGFALGVLPLAIAACRVFGSDNEGASPPPAGEQPGVPPAPGETPKAPPVGGPAASEELTEKFGVFVAPSGADRGDGTRARPLAHIQPAIDLAKKLGKRVYVCSGVYREALVVSDSISIIGGLSCATPEWKTGAPPARVESPTSPAILAKDIVTATRLESLDVVAPSATTPGSSSIGLLGERASALVIATSKIVAGDAAKGEDGTEGIALTNAATANGAPATAAEVCAGQFSACLASPNYKPPAKLGGTNTCAGAPGFVAEAGGYGGSGGTWETYLKTFQFAPSLPSFRLFENKGALDAAPGQVRTAAVGAAGTAGQNGAAIGVISAAGYQPGDGSNGGNAGAGSGGSGEAGQSPPGPAPDASGTKWVGRTGASGGAGGCPGLAGTAGKGGGASIAVLLVASATTFDATEIVSGRGGDAGLGAFGSLPTPGGTAAAPAAAGGRGGAAGISGNGGAGPSIGIAHVGAAPKLVGTTKATPGKGGAAVEERTRTDDALGVTSTVPATPAGLSTDILAL